MNQIIKHIAIIFILLSPIVISAQNSNLIATIIDEKDSSAISYVTTRLIDMNNKVIQGVISDSEGKILLKDIPFGNYFLRMSFISYENLNLEILIDSTFIDLDTLILRRKISEIDEIVISAEHSIERLIDRTVFRFDSLHIKNKVNALDAIGTLPGIKYNEKFENLQMIGRGNPEIYINGISRNLKELSLVRAGDIDKVEIIRNSSSEFGSAGTAIINVVTKQRIEPGFSANMNLVTNMPDISKGLDIGLQYGFSKLRLYFNYSFSERKIPILDSIYRKNLFEDDNFTSYTLSKNTNELQNLAHYFSYGIDYFINKRNQMGIYATDYIKDYTNETIRTSQLYTNENYTDKYTTVSLNQSSSRNRNVGFFFKHLLKKENAFFWIAGNYFKFNRLENIVYKDSFQDIISEISTINNRIEINKRTKESFSAQVKLYYPVSDKVNISMGDLFYIKYEDIFFENPTNKYALKSNILKNSPYINIKTSIKGVDIFLGNSIDLYLETFGDTLTKKNLTYIPYVSINKQINKKHSLNFSYSKRVDYPMYFHLLPYANQKDLLETSPEGNWDLKPMKWHYAELNYSHITKGFYTSINLYIKQISDMIYPIFFIDNSNIAGSKYQNFGYFRQYGLNLNERIVIKDKFTINPSFDISYDEAQDPYNETKSLINPKYYLDVIYNYSDKVEFNLSFAYSGGYISTNSLYKSSPEFSFTTTFSVLKEKGKFKINIDPFNRIDNSNWFDNGNIYNSQKTYHSKSITLNFSYNFNKGTQIKSIRKARLQDNENR